MRRIGSQAIDDVSKHTPFIRTVGPSPTVEVASTECQKPSLIVRANVDCWDDERELRAGARRFKCFHVHAVTALHFRFLRGGEKCPPKIGGKCRGVGGFK